MALNAIQLDNSGDFSLLYNFFNVENYTGTQAYSSYALPNTPLYFKPVLNDSINQFISNKTVLWDFGDGTTSNAVSASHAYTEPGKYKVTCYFYDGDGISYYNVFSVDIDIFDFIEDRLSISSDFNINHKTGQLKNPITIERYNSIHAIENGTLPTITSYVSSGVGDTYDYFKQGLDEKAYGHLYPNFTLFQYLTTNGIIEPVPVETITTTNTDIYVKLSDDNELIQTAPNSAGAVFAGVSGTAVTYFKSDQPGIYNLLFGFEESSVFNYTNTTTYGISAEITANPSVDSLSITSNGVDGEGTPLNIFDINDVKFAGTEIAFVIRVKDSEYFTQKQLGLFDIRPAGPLTVVLTDGITEFDINVTSNFMELSSLDTGGFYKGMFSSLNDTTLENVYLSASYIHPSGTVTGTSNTFNIYPSNHYVLAKQSEDIDFTDIFNDITTQPLFNDTPVLINDFLGSIFGDLSSAQDSIGKSTYEKIKNFQDNNTIIDYANIDQLASILTSLDLKSLNKFSIPAKISRLLDLLSISKSRLFGDINRNQENYSTFGYANNECYGVNLGSILTSASTVVPGNDIVAFEKYSGRYTRLNTYLPLSSPLKPNLYTSSLGTTYYKLSDYNGTWGWGLLSDGSRDIFDIYTFYEQVDSDLPVTGSVINFEDPNNTLTRNLTSYTDWSRDNGTISNILANALYDGLELFYTTQTYTPPSPPPVTDQLTYFIPDASFDTTYPNAPADLSAELINRIGTPRNAKKEIFNSYEVNSVVTRRVNWAKDLDFSGVAWDTTRAGTLIHPRVALVAKHYPRSVGSSITFHDKQGIPQTRIIEKAVNLQSTDITVLLLNYDTVGCAVYPIPSSQDLIQWSSILGGTNVIATVQSRQLIVQRIYNTDNNITGFVRTCSAVTPAELCEPLVTGDSGHPTFLVYGNNLVLLGLHWTVNVDSSLFKSEVQDELRSVVESIDNPLNKPIPI